jgi:hypothetical protein
MTIIGRGPITLAPGSWRTLETFYGRVSTTVGYFRDPAGVRIKVRYGYGWFGFDRQQQTLDGINVKNLTVSGWVGYARMQARSDQAVSFSWGIAVASPDAPQPEPPWV